MNDMNIEIVDSLKSKNNVSALSVCEEDTVLSVPNITLPEDENLIGWNFDPVAASSLLEVEAGKIYISRIDLHNSAEISEVIIKADISIPSKINTEQCFLGIYDENGVIIFQDKCFNENTFTEENVSLVLCKTLNYEPQSIYVAILFNGESLPQIYAAPINASTKFSYNTLRFGELQEKKKTLPKSLSSKKINPSIPSIWLGIK